MKKILCAGVAALLLTTTVVAPARAWGGGFVFGTAVGIGVGTAFGLSVARPYPYYYPPYGYYPYGYYPSAYPYPYPYAVPYGYAYPYPYGRVVYAAPPVGVPVQAPGAVYAQPASIAPAPAASGPRVACRAGQFFNTLTGNCDRR